MVECSEDATILNGKRKWGPRKGEIIEKYFRGSVDAGNTGLLELLLQHDAGRTRYASIIHLNEIGAREEARNDAGFCGLPTTFNRVLEMMRKAFVP